MESSLTKISLIFADAILVEIDKKRFGINFCKKSQDYIYFRRLMKPLQYYQVNKDMELASLVYLGETIDAYDLRTYVEEKYCPAITKVIKAL